MVNRSNETSQGNEQYFSANPSSEDVRRTLHVTLRGREADVEVSNGVFSSGRLDLGTSVLLRHVPDPASAGKETPHAFLDLGCGWGPITLALAEADPRAEVWAVDVNDRAIALTAHNAEANGYTGVHACRPEDVPEDLRFDTIWSNPAIRIGKEALHDMLMTWLPRLAPGGEAYLVVQRNLGSDSLMRWLADALGDGFSVGKYASSKGYRIIEILRK
ncbi:class I SAM-dependent methyltransferase [Bifidobacterium simiarum]|uniref:class I SAM-dependent methyltransferase n=1 Tax=Bifidobacterium simiarum TaxID=2045441 RepID=UPI001BDD5342|nr:methyltransferase [Bifidobacterium simiarum]MBT1165323.1 methyltransferase [Bifidobacterium simiarum]